MENLRDENTIHGEVLDTSDIKPVILPLEFLSKTIKAILDLIEQILDRDPNTSRAEKFKSEVLEIINAYQDLIDQERRAEIEAVGLKLKKEKRKKSKVSIKDEEDSNGDRLSADDVPWETLFDDDETLDKLKELIKPTKDKCTDTVKKKKLKDNFLKVGSCLRQKLKKIDRDKYKILFDDESVESFSDNESKCSTDSECREILKACEEDSDAEDVDKSPKRSERTFLVKCNKSILNGSFWRTMKRLDVLCEEEIISVVGETVLKEPGRRKKRKQRNIFLEDKIKARRDSQLENCSNISVVRYTCTECDVSYVHDYFLEGHRASCKGRRMRFWDESPILKLEQQDGRALCPVCGATFRTEQNLMRHIMLHKFEQLKTSDLNIKRDESIQYKNTDDPFNPAVVTHTDPFCDGEEIASGQSKVNTDANSLSHNTSLLNGRLDINSKNSVEKREAAALGDETNSLSRAAEIEKAKISSLENQGLKYSLEDIVYKLPEDESAEEVQECQQCKRKIPTRLLDVHILMVHVEKANPFICNNCPKTFKYMFSLAKHAKEIHEVKMADGKNYYLANAKDLERKKYPKAIKMKVFACIICSRKFPWRYLLKEHMETHKVGSANRKSPKVDMRKSVRRKDGSFLCKDCGRAFNTYTGLYKHGLIEHVEMDNNEAKSVQLICDTCNKTFFSKYNLRLHMQIHNPNRRKFICEECGMAFTMNGNLKRHKDVHLNVKKYKCNVCKKHFRYKGTLTTHLRIHSGEKPWFCEICSCRFSERRRWLIHMNNHKGIKPYKCQVDWCTKAFVDRKHFNKHMLEHTDIRNN